MNKEGYQPIKTKKTTKIIPPNTGSNVQMKKDGYTWEDLEKAWWEGFDTCKAKVGEENVKLNDELEKLKKQLEELPDKWCRNKDDYCPYLATLEQENAELRKTETMLKILKDRGVIKSWYYNGSYHVGNELPRQEDKMNCNCKDDCFLVKELEKENAELKAQLSDVLECFISASSGDDFEMAESAREVMEVLNIRCYRHGEVKSKLTKAKELLIRFVMASVYFNGKETDLVEEAEQFLKR